MLPLLLVLMCYSVFAQDISLKWGKANDKKVKTESGHSPFKSNVSPIQVIGENEEGMPVTYDLTQFTGFQKVAAGEEVSIGCLTTAHHVYITGEIISEKEQKVFMYIAEINLKGEIIRQPLLIGSSPFKTKMNSVSWDRYYYIKPLKDLAGIYMNKERTYFAYFALPPDVFVEKNNEVLYATVFDENLTNLWQATLNFPYKPKFVWVNNATLTSNGTLILSSRIQRDDEFDNKTQQEFFQQFWIYKGDKHAETKLEISKGVYPGNFAIAEIDSSHIVVSGFYHDNIKADGLSYKAVGIFNVKIEVPSGKVAASGFQPFSQSTLENLKKPVVWNTYRIFPEYHLHPASLEVSGKGEILLLSWVHDDDCNGNDYYFSISPELKVTGETIAIPYDKTHFNRKKNTLNLGDNILLLHPPVEDETSIPVTFIDFSGKPISKAAIEPPKECYMSLYQTRQFADKKLLVAAISKSNSNPGTVMGILTVK